MASIWAAGNGWSFDELVRRRAEGADQGQEQRHHRGPDEDGTREGPGGIVQGSAHQERDVT